MSSRQRPILAKELPTVSRPILEITLHLPEGQVLTGRGRNVPATMERIYNQALNPQPRRHVKFIHGLKPGESRYRGTYNVEFSYHTGRSTIQDGIVRAEVVGPK